MIETYGKFTALDGTEFHYSDFRASRKEAAAKAEARDQAILAAREKQKGRPLTIRETLEPVRQTETPPSKPIDARPSPSNVGIKLPYPLTAPARPLTPAEEAGKKAFQEMHLAAIRAEEAKKARQ